MKKYSQIIKNTIAEYMVYRLNFTLWRVRYVIRILVLYFLWQAIFTSRQEIFGYDQAQILTYILLINIVGSIIFSTKTQDVGNEIQQGDLTNWLLRPINYFSYLISRDVADKLLNIGFAVIEVSLILFFLRPPIIWQSNPVLLFITTMAIGIGLVLYFLISLILSLFSFWTQEAWGPRFLFFIINEFLSGGLFPLDILPPSIFAIITFLPFPYLLFFPLKIYLGQLTPWAIVQGFVISLFWVGILSFMVRTIWKKGLRLYAAEGR